MESRKAEASKTSVMCMLFGIEGERAIPNNTHYSDCDEGAFGIMPVPPDATAHFILIESKIFRIFARPLRRTSVLQWPEPSSADWSEAGRRRSNRLFGKERRGIGG